MTRMRAPMASFRIYDEFGFLPGTYTIQLRASAAGYVPATYQGSWTQPTSLGHNFDLFTPLTLVNGTVLGGDTKTGIPGAAVSITRYNPTSAVWEWVADAVTDDAGVFTAKDEAGLGAGEYRFTATAAGYFPTTVSASYSGSTPVTVNITLQPIPAIAQGTVTIAGSKGTPVVGAHVDVWLLPPTGAGTLVGSTLTDEGGVFVFLDVARAARAPTGSTSTRRGSCREPTLRPGTASPGSTLR